VRKLRQQWADLSLEKKLGFAVPLVIAGVTGVIVPVLLAGGGGSGAEHQDQGSELEVIDLAVSDGQALAASSAKAQETAYRTETVDVTVRNAGDLVSIVTGIGFGILSAGFLEICEGGGAGLPPSETYDVQLPTTAHLEGDRVVASPEEVEGRLLEYKISQEIPPGEADRFTVRLEVPPERQLGVDLYQLEVLLYHDADPEPASAGTVLVSVPSPDSFHFRSYVPAALRSGERASIRKCYERNRATYQEMLALEGERSPELTADLMQSQ
jgi:hypothetical protein